MSTRVPSYTVRNLDWTINKNSDDTYNLDQVQLAVLMDIRGALRSLLGIFQCYNFTRIPRLIDQLVKNTKRKRKPKDWTPVCQDHPTYKGKIKPRVDCAGCRIIYRSKHGKKSRR